MTRTPDEIKKGLETCSADECHGQHTDCPYHPDLMCIRNICADALALIQQLQAQNAEQAEKIKQLEAERDAAVADIKQMAHDPYEPCFCDYCKLTEEECSQANCRGRNAFEWRGVQKEN